tara:strand:- start:493 stop:1482 length:990 start_codon:yes stop_codon:yes gene_type:complete
MCVNCDEIIQVGNSGTDGWSPILALVEGTCDGDPITVHQLVSWQDGSGTRPIYSGNIMTDAWLLANPIYLGSAGLITDICSATNLIGGNGSNGNNGSNGTNGADACIPEIGITAAVVGDTVTPLTVTENFDVPCAPTYDIEFPISIFTSDTVVDSITDSAAFSTAVTTAVNSVISGLLAPAEIMISPLTINNTGSPDVLYSEFISTTSLSFNTGGTTSYISYKVIGNLMYLNFRFVIDVPPGSTSQIKNFQVKIPGGYLSANTSDVSAISRYSIDKPAATYTPLISTNNVDDGYLIISAYNDDTNLTSFRLVQGSTEYFQGQITFTITD